MKEYNINNLEFARSLRKNMTPSERRLWYEFLRNYNVRFRRQALIGDYIVDFYCPKAKLVVEIDGGQHYIDKNIELDNKRTEYLKKQGLKVIRFSNLDVSENFYGVCETIDRTVGSPCQGSCHEVTEG